MEESQLGNADLPAKALERPRRRTRVEIQSHRVRARQSSSYARTSSRELKSLQIIHGSNAATTLLLAFTTILRRSSDAGVTPCVMGPTKMCSFLKNPETCFGRQLDPPLLSGSGMSMVGQLGVECFNVLGSEESHGGTQDLAVERCAKEGRNMRVSVFDHSHGGPSDEPSPSL
jgi:hypothetical protein